MAAYTNSSQAVIAIPHPDASTRNMDHWDKALEVLSSSLPSESFVPRASSHHHSAFLVYPMDNIHSGLYLWRVARAHEFFLNNLYPISVNGVLVQLSDPSDVYGMKISDLDTIKLAIEGQRKYMEVLIKYIEDYVQVPVSLLYTYDHRDDYKTPVDILGEEIASRLSIFVYHIDDIEQLKGDFKPLVQKVAGNTIEGRITVSEIPDAFVSIKSVGIQPGASELFVREVGLALIEKGEAFNLWEERGDQFNEQESISLKTMPPEFVIKYQNYIISPLDLSDARIVGDPPPQIQPGRHFYIEYNGLVFSNIIGSQKAPPISKYQTDIMAHSRNRIELPDKMGKIEFQELLDQLTSNEY